MKNNIMLVVLVSGALLTNLHAATNPEYQPATVVSVESRAIPSNYAGGSPADAPSQSEVYSYDIGIRLGDTVYMTAFDSAVDELPSDLAANRQVQVNLKKRVMEVELSGDRTLEMAIENRTAAKDVSRMAGN
jgi:hypothetical protein